MFSTYQEKLGGWGYVLKICMQEKSALNLIGKSGNFSSNDWKIIKLGLDSDNFSA